MQDSRIEWNNNNDVPGALRSEAAQWSDWLERFTAAYLGPSVSAYSSYYPFLNNSRFRFFKRTENVGVLDLWCKYIYVTAPCYVVGARVSFWFSPSNFRPVSVFPVADGWKVLCWFSTEQEMCFHSSAISETGDLFRSVFEMCVLKMPSWNKAEKSFHTVRQLLRADLRSTRISRTQGTFTAVVMVTVSRECVSIVGEKARRLVLASPLPVTTSRVTPTNSTCFTFLTFQRQRLKPGGCSSSTLAPKITITTIFTFDWNQSGFFFFVLFKQQQDFRVVCVLSFNLEGNYLSWRFQIHPRKKSFYTC